MVEYTTQHTTDSSQQVHALITLSHEIWRKTQKSNIDMQQCQNMTTTEPE